MSNLLSVEIKTDSDLIKVRDDADALREVARAEIERAQDNRPFRKGELGSRPMNDVRSYFRADPSLLTKRDLRGLDQIHRLASAALDPLPMNSPSPVLRTPSPIRWEREGVRAGFRTTDEGKRALEDLREVMVAMRNNRRPAVPEKVGVLLPWKLAARNRDRSIGHGQFPASNLASNSASGSTTPLDLSLMDPGESTFWRRPTSIAQQDLRVGFGRGQMPALADGLCEYTGPKTSAGTKPGFEVEFDGEEYQVKLMEVNSEPFTARIFAALGYHVDPTDYVPGIKVRYDRRLLREFNLRTPITMEIRPFGIPLGNVNLQPDYSPFDYIEEAVFADERRISGGQLRKLLFHRPHGTHPENDPDNFNSEVEQALEYIIIAPANVQLKDQPSETIGMWDFDGLGHEERRELRGAGLLAAWLGWFDARFDNTRLRTLETNGVVTFQHFFTDLGAGMGGGDGWLLRHGENPDYFETTFTRSRTRGTPNSPRRHFEVIHYQTVFPCPAFREMTVDDARWMARLIAQLTPRQLRDALLASGYDGETTDCYLAKLISRRDRMIRDLGLEGEIPLLQYAPR